MLLCLTSTIQTNAQTPANDPHWNLNTTVITDEFNYTGTHSQIINSMKAKWHFIENWGNQLINNNYPITYTTDNGSNVYVNNGICTITVEHQTTPVSRLWPCNTCWNYGNPPSSSNNFNYTNGSLLSNGQSKFGYYELKFRLPNNVNHVGIYPAFWFFAESQAQSCPPYEEIDVFEMVGDGSYYKFGPTIHYGGMSNNGPTQNFTYENIGWADNKLDYKAPFNYDVNFSDGQFHNIGFEWQAEYVSIYLDGILQRSMNFYQDQIRPKNLYIAVGLDNLNNNISNTVFPFNFEVDYIRYYQLNYAILANLTVNYNNYSNGTLGYTMRNNITLGATGYTAKINSGSNLILRAANSITLSDGFECDANTTMYLQVNNSQ